MKTVGIKLADGSFYPVMEEGSAQAKKLDLTTAHSNQTCVMVDMYRSQNCSMDDAEYIDTLKIDNLKAHPNGEPDISFNVELDENGKLNATIADPETGATSNSNITLVSRTLEERLQADDYTISHAAITDEEAVAAENNEADEDKLNNTKAAAAGAVAGGGLLAAMSAIRKRENMDDNDFNLGDPEYNKVDENETFAGDETVVSDDNAFAADETVVSDNSFNLPETDSTSTDNFDLPDDNIFASDTSSDNLEKDIFGTDSSDPFATDETAVGGETAFAADEASLNDDLFAEPAADTAADETAVSDDTFDLPETDSTGTDNFDLPEGSVLDDNAFAADNDDLNFDDSFADNSSSSDDDNMAASGGLSFTGLYDKETAMGEPGMNQDENSSGKTKAPVIICIICAVICLLATAFILFVVPSKFNLISKKTDKAESENTIELKAEEPAPSPAAVAAEEKKPEPAKEIVPAAKEDEVVIIEKAEEVVPLPPPVVEEKKPEVTYKIKWGDTLWDIADTYYKNPWKYKKIAKYNGIKNPDHIISGTVITIPE